MSKDEAVGMVTKMLSRQAEFTAPMLREIVHRKRA